MVRPIATVAVRTATSAVTVIRLRADGSRGSAPDRVATEEPLQIMLGGGSDRSGPLPSRPVAVTMRTPGNDFELAVGFCLTEGLITAGEVREVKYCEVPQDQPQLYNVVTVRVARRIDESDVAARTFTAGASCGLCGKTTLDEIEQVCEPLGEHERSQGPFVTASVLLSLPDRLREAQKVFSTTGGLHAAGLFDIDGAPAVIDAGEGQGDAGQGDWGQGEAVLDEAVLVVAREDVGRHNAVDKAIGWAVLNGRVPLERSVLVVSGRASFEIVQKAAMARIPVVAAVSAPSSLAVDAARRLGLTLVGFVRGDTANVYTHPERIT